MEIILIAGGMRAGKDTFADACCAELVSHGKSAKKVSLAAPLKELVYKIETETGVRIGKNRSLLQWIGTQWGRNIDEQLWVKAIERRLIDESTTGLDYAFVPDVRFENETDILRFGWPCKVNKVFVRASELVRIERGAEIAHMGHESEAFANSMSCWSGMVGWTYLDNNDSIESFCDQAALYAKIILDKE